MAEEISAALENVAGAWDWSSGISFNTALVFIKPHAVNPQVQEFVTGELKKAGGQILCEGTLSAEEIEKDGIIDNHYAAIAKHAMETDPTTLSMSGDKAVEFEAEFGTAWPAALQTGTVMNCARAMEQMAQDGTGVAKVWDAAPKKFKIAPGCYVAKVMYVMAEDDEGDTKAVPAEEGADDAMTGYLVNGFYGGMRQQFVAEGAQVHYFCVGFTSNELTWTDFREKVIGATDPEKAEGSSIRGQLYKKYEQLGLTDQPNTSINGVHASAGPLEGLKERMVWLGLVPDQDPYGQKLLEVLWGSPESLDQFLADETFTFAGETKGMFDLTECKESLDVLCICNNIVYATPAETEAFYGKKEEPPAGEEPAEEKVEIEDE